MNRMIGLLLLIVSSFASAEEGKTRVADLAKTYAEVSGKAVVVNRDAMREVTPLERGLTPTLQMMMTWIRSADMDLVESDGLVRIVKKQDINHVKTEMAEAENNKFCSHASSETINTNFPEPTEITDIIRAYSLWLGMPVVLDRNVTGKVQIRFNKKIALNRSCRIWISALNQLGLELLSSNDVAIVLPSRNKDKWIWPQVASSETSNKNVNFEFSEPTSIKDVIKKYNLLTDGKIEVANGVDGRLIITGAQELPKSKLNEVFNVAIAKIGLRIDGNKVVQ